MTNWFFLLFFVSGFFSPVRAEDTSAPETVTLPEIVAEGKRLRGDHRSAVVLTEHELDREAGRSIGEVLRETAGVDGNLGTSGNASVTLRGSTGAQVLVIIDGVKANDPSSPNRFFDWSRIDVTQIARIDVLKGPQAVSYGSDAIGGVILIRTKRGGERMNASLEGGSQEFFRGQATLGIPFSEKHVLRLEAHGKGVFDGESSAASPNSSQDFERDNEREGEVGAQLASDWGSSVRSELSANLRATHEDIDSGAFADDPTALARSREMRGSLRFSGQVGERGDWSALVSHLDFRRSYFFGMTSVIRGRNTRGEFQYRQGFANGGELATGLEAVQESVDFVSAADMSGAIFTEGRVPFLLSGKNELLAVDGGTRFTHFRRIGDHWSGKAGLASSPSEDLKFDLGIATGIKAPSLSALYDPFSGNPGLKPEESVEIEAGGELAVSRDLHFSLRGFESHVRNRFGFAPPPTYRGLNIASALIDGIEFENETILTKSFRVRPSVTYLHTVDRSTGEPLQDTPKWKAGVKFEWDPSDRTSVIASLLAKTSRLTSAHAGRVGGFSRLDLSARTRFTDRWSGTARIENALDHDYQEVYGFTTPGISGFLGVEYRD